MKCSDTKKSLFIQMVEGHFKVTAIVLDLLHVLGPNEATDRSEVTTFIRNRAKHSEYDWSR